MKNILIYTLLIFATLSCRNDGTTFVPETIASGKLYMHNSFTDSEKTIVPNTVVKLCKDADSSKIVLQTTTNTNGEFEFKYKPENTENLILYAESEITSVKYRGRIKNLSDSLILKPIYENGLQILLKDKANEPITAINVYLFNNLQYAVEAQKTKETIAGNIYNGTTNKYGNYFIGNIVSSNYYVLAKGKIGSLNFSKLDSISIKVTQKQPIIKHTMVLEVTK